MEEKSSRFIYNGKIANIKKQKKQQKYQSILKYPLYNAQA